jgi:hypothetical protein
MARTKSTNQPKDAAALSELAERLREWRESRPRGQRIPEELWKAATDLGRIHGVSPTASALKVNFLQLQQRLLAGGFGRGKGPARPAFIELPPAASPPDQSERGTLEVVQASGARLTLRLPHATAKELQPLVHLFLRERL